MHRRDRRGGLAAEAVADAFHAAWEGEADKLPGVTRARQRDSDGAESDLPARLREHLIDRLAQGGRSGDAATNRTLRHLLRLLEGDEGPERRRSALCEAAVALRLLARGARLQFEVPTARGRTADFLVRSPELAPDMAVALHVKRWTPPRERASTTLRVPGAMRSLERVRRPYLVGVRWPSAKELYDPFVAEGSHFLLQGSVGDEWVYRDADDVPCGGLRILAPWPGDRVILTVGLDATIEDEMARVQRLLRKAHAQFLDDVPNLIVLVGGSREDDRLIDTSIFGSHVERWDLYPPRGHRVAHGRGDDGFWSGERYAESRAIAWCTWTEQRGVGSTKLWFRSRAEAMPAVRDLLGA